MGAAIAEGFQNELLSAPHLTPSVLSWEMKAGATRFPRSGLVQQIRNVNWRIRVEGGLLGVNRRGGCSEMRQKIRLRPGMAD